MATEATVMGLFTDEQQTARVIEEMRSDPRWTIRRVHSPIPSHRIARAMKVKKSLLGWCTLVGGIIGFFSGFALAAFTASRWGLIVSGKPVIALVPFFIVGFEFTILFAVFGNIVGLIATSGLPDYKGLAVYDPRCTGHHYGIVATCADEEQEQLSAFFREKGGEPGIPVPS